MLKFTKLILLFLVVSFNSLSQLTIEDAIVNEKDEITTTSKTTLDKRFVWTNNKKTNNLLCFVYDFAEEDPVGFMKWDIERTLKDKEGVYFFVKSSEGVELMISFYKNKGLVYGFNELNKTCFFITGETLDFSEICK